MNKILNTFKTPKVFLPVIHANSKAGALESIHIAREEGAHGVFLIDQKIPWYEVFSTLVESIRINHDFWHGVNILSMNPAHVLSGPEFGQPFLNGVWSDNAKIDEYNAPNDQPYAQNLLKKKNQGFFSGLYFGGVAFKYQREVKDIGQAAKCAIPYVDVITTSGDATGVAASLSKVKEFRDAMGDHALALASGVTPENIDTYLPYVDAFLVATGIEKEFGILDPQKVASLARKIKEYK